ncbi:MAG TPA: dihydrofolate reductase family protein [Gemmatimonadaceae bacterium]|nr:dihydrofolate reductase family protein [Gemmatimonadaceae bacterium]
MKTQYYTASSLDGFIADAKHSLDWLFQFSDGPLGDFPEFLNAVGAIAMGSSTYEWMLKHLILPGAEHPQEWPYGQPTWIFTSRKLPTIDGADIRFVRGDVRVVHADMVKVARGKNVWIVGGGDLAGQFHDHGLLDEMIVSLASVTLGSGAPLLPRLISAPPMRLVSARTYGTAFAHLTYQLPQRRHPADKSPV